MMLQFSYPLALSYHLHSPLPQFSPHTLHHIIQYCSQSRANRVLFWLHAPRSYMLWNTFMMFSNSPFSVWDQPRPASLSRQSTLNLNLSLNLNCHGPQSSLILLRAFSDPISQSWGRPNAARSSEYQAYRVFLGSSGWALVIGGRPGEKMPPPKWALSKTE